MSGNSETDSRRTIACEGCGAKYAPAYAKGSCPVCDEPEPSQELSEDYRELIELLGSLEISRDVKTEYNPKLGSAHWEVRLNPEDADSGGGAA